MTEYTVEFVGTGETIEVADTETILSACFDEGIAQEYSCRVGMCLACSAEIVEGEVTSPRPAASPTRRPRSTRSPVWPARSRT
jgi:ferredoxin